MNRAALLWIGGSVFLAAWGFHLAGHFLVVPDMVQYGFPEKWVGVEIWNRGHVPLWNPFLGCGIPHHANGQAACFYPPSWIWNWTGLSRGYFPLSLLHTAWAAWGLFLWLLQRRAHAGIAFLASASFSLSSTMTRAWAYPGILAAFSWLPWVFWAADRYLDRPGRERWTVWVACLALQALAGYPQVQAYTVLFLAAWVVARRPGIRSAGGAVLAGAAAFLLAAVQWVPWLDFMGHHHRSSHGGALYCVSPRELLYHLHPNAWGMPETPDYSGAMPGCLFLPAYSGLAVPVVLLAAAFFLVRLKERFFLAVSFLLVFWTLGVHFKPWKALLGWAVNLLEPAKAGFLVPFFACTAAALAAGQAWRHLRSSTSWRRIAMFAAVLVVLDALAVPFRVLERMPDPFREPGVLEKASFWASQAGDGRIASLRPSRGVSDLRAIATSRFLRDEVDRAAPNTNAVLGLRACGAVVSTTLDGYTNLLLYMQRGFPYEGRVLDAAGVRVFLLPDRLTPGKYRTVRDGSGRECQVNDGAMPPAWCVPEVEVLGSRPEVYRRMMLPDAPIERVAFLEGENRTPGIGLPPPAGGRPAPLRDDGEGKGPGRDLDDSPGRVLLRSGVPMTGWLVYSENCAPGWKAWVDGRPAPLYRADGFAMAVPLGTQGVRRVDIRYEPVAFRLGLFLSFLLLSFLVGLSWPGRVP